MLYENGIPEYALQPAKAPQKISAEGIYHAEQMKYPAKQKCAIYQIEEDILVPDTKEDMREILFIDGTCDLTPREKSVLPKPGEPLTLSGMLTVQTVYQPERDRTAAVTINAKVPYQYSWDLQTEESGEGVFSCEVKRIEYSIINERKFRIKATLLFSSRLYIQKEVLFFDGLKNEDLEMKTSLIELSCLSAVKKDEVSIDEMFSYPEHEKIPEIILKQSVRITETYRQVTTEKIVLNGFIYVQLLYQTTENTEGNRDLCTHQQRIEFTQFIPLSKEQRGRKWSAVKPAFQNRDLCVTIHQGEEHDAKPCFHIKGTIDLRIELYERKQKEMVVDAYHKEKNFCCNYRSVTMIHSAECVTTEIPVREVIHLQEREKAENAIYCMSKIIDFKNQIENGRVSIWGSVESRCLWQNEQRENYATTAETEFQGFVDLEQTANPISVVTHLQIKQCGISLIHEKQLELNYTVLISIETFEEKELILLENPGFTDLVPASTCPMTIVIMQPDECLWDLAKQYRTTEEKIREINRLEGEPEPGQKLLMIK